MKSLSMLAGTMALAGLLCGCATPVHGGDRHAVGTLRFIGEQRIAPKLAYAGTTVGGLSGIDYDPARATWIIVSDDRSNLQAARFYTARLAVSGAALGPVELTGTHALRQADGSPHPDVGHFATDGGTVLDLESIRFDPLDGSIWYTSEGDGRFGLDPLVRHARSDGTLLGELPLPPLLRISRDGRTGARNNLNLESLSFAPDGASLWIALEAPLYQDGPVPSVASGALCRMVQLDRAGKVLRQVAYPADPIPAPPGPGKAAETGIAEILASGQDKLLVLERAAVQGADGAYRNHIRLYEADVTGATDVAALPALAGAMVVPARKRLVLDLDTLALPRVDNIEGMSWGPRLANGHATLVLVADDNFSASQVTQVMLFEVLP
ncbi:esterase-like activity of phytase family protein [Pseudoduganella chitinolytica]|uniref:Esterase-like activity of phytase family protein n=1 Tax=Pseudoduganella chitinolytica TaxID=34070 RepID=A0ABY8BDD8_9BURK|nr:esterase-like activity of phytase family protein [Pseudoduganella chitinolytica]WEF33930.1 esterase-like activity of phytase family protein [Pseudoduganella chitinolytica]